MKWLKNLQMNKIIRSSIGSVDETMDVIYA